MGRNPFGMTTNVSTEGVGGGHTDTIWTPPGADAFGPRVTVLVLYGRSVVSFARRIVTRQRLTSGCIDNGASHAAPGPTVAVDVPTPGAMVVRQPSASASEIVMSNRTMRPVADDALRMYSAPRQAEVRICS